MRLGPLLRRSVVVAILLLSAGLASPASGLATAESGSDGRIAFADDRTGTLQVYTVRPDGSGLRQLTNTAGHPSFNTAWSPDGRTIAFDSFRAGGGVLQIFTMRPDGTHVRQLTNDPVLWSVNPAWSPDGRKLAFSLESAEGPPGGDIYVMNADGSGRRALTSGAAHDWNPTWSPGGAQIAFNSDRTGPGTSAVYQMHADGSHVRRLTPLDLDAFGPDYAPDGRHVAFSSNLDVPDSAIYVIRPDGSGLRQLTSPPPGGGGDAWVSYSPDGRKLAFATDRRDGNSDLWVMDADGTDLVDITPTPPSNPFQTGGRRDRRSRPYGDHPSGSGTPAPPQANRDRRSSGRVQRSLGARSSRCLLAGLRWHLPCLATTGMDCPLAR
jgi:TolB protein